MFDSVVSNCIKQAKEIGNSIEIRWDNHRKVWQTCQTGIMTQKNIFATVYADGNIHKGPHYYDFEEK